MTTPYKSALELAKIELADEERLEKTLLETIEKWEKDLIEYRRRLSRAGDEISRLRRLIQSLDIAAHGETP